MLSEISALQSTNTTLESIDLSQQAFFVSGTRCLVTQRQHHRFTTQIKDHDVLVSQLKRELAKCSSNDAIAFGVLPFCKTQQAQFIVTEQAHQYDKETFKQWLNAKGTLKQDTMPSLERISHRQSQHHYESAIREAKKLFANEQLEKIVLGKQVDLYFDAPLSPETILTNLLTQSPSGFHFSFPTEQNSTLMGVSPELLLRKHGQAVLSNPLAGSAKRSNDKATEFKLKQALMASKKDRYEHAVVLVEMSQVLQPWCQKLTIPSSPSLLSTATMWHLSTEVEGQLADANTHVLALANRLHPTPALCGKPTADAYPWIHSLEGESRDFFSGIVGWCDKHGNGEWVVVIRSGEISANHARLFAGAGIVAASDPTAEWLETEAKLSTMLNALESNQAYHQLSQIKMRATA
ncbi:isochorismate synthase [Pseudoalteromonas piscicida]